MSYNLLPDEFTSTFSNLDVAALQSLWGEGVTMRQVVALSTP